MPLRDDRSRIRIRYCPKGHDKYVEGVMAAPSGGSHCYRCVKDKSYARKKKRYHTDPEWRAKQIERVLNLYYTNSEYRARRSNGWQNPLNAIRDTQRRIRKRREHKIEQMQDLLAQLEGETNG